MTARILGFRDQFRFLSNFWPVVVDYEGILYPSSEHAYQAAKTLDQDARERIAWLPTPGEAKRAGQKIELRPDWNDVRDQVMLDILTVKFHADETLMKLLVATDDAELIEGNHWHDQYWGDCKCGRPACAEPGRNQLGVTLMQVRTNLVAEKPWRQP